MILEKVKKLNKWTIAFGISYSITSFINAILVLLKEGGKHTVHAWMTAATGNHWATHGVIDILLFFILAWMFASIKSRDISSFSPNKLITIVVGSTVISSLIIIVYFSLKVLSYL